MRSLSQNILIRNIVALPLCSSDAKKNHSELVLASCVNSIFITPETTISIENNEFEKLNESINAHNINLYDSKQEGNYIGEQLQIKPPLKEIPKVDVLVKKGENGEPVNISKHLLNEEEKKEYKNGWKYNAFNEYLSNRISLNRTLNDQRDEKSPTMAGGLFAISRAYLTYIGTYDDGMDIWGGENLEISFRIWMCGGTLETTPCSHVGHIFRKRSPYKWRKNVDVVRKNNIRLCEVWLDEYKQYYNDKIGIKTFLVDMCASKRYCVD
ncbi:GALNT [Mytilus coruscus]|uniref:GALNT n=1 Tax=Mytilus coruscus TaxID=42192 RepID=A0A6J8EUX7_MYTCO|nr:GALNT [Mytilus coruscus]